MRDKRSNLWGALFAIAFILFVFGFQLYKNVLPFQFPNQWQATSNNLNLTGEYDENNESGEFLGKSVKSSNLTQNENFIANNQVLGESKINESSESNELNGSNTADEKRIEVDLSKQMVYAYEGDNKVMEFLVSSGKWGKTPTGEFTIAYKTLSQTMSGGSKALRTSYYLPNVQYVQFFGNKEIPWGRGFSFHGTYWHNNFGTPMSHGCLNMRNEDAKALFEWTNPTLTSKRIVKATADNPGTKVIIYGKPPK
jgi:lipoprotein-anchoring transpeptidase ErfK/SrfK